jgi:hypothetical protein
MSVTSISPFIVLHADRSALLDIKNRVLYLTLSRLLGRFEVQLPEALRALERAKIHIRFDPVNGNSCIDFEDIPYFLSAIRPAERNDRHNRQHRKTLLEHEALAIELETNGLLDLPRILSKKLLFTLQNPGIWEDKNWQVQAAFTGELPIWAS